MKKSYNLKKLLKYLKFNEKIQKRDLDFKQFENFPYLTTKKTSDQEYKIFFRTQSQAQKYIFGINKVFDNNFFKRTDVILLLSNFVNSIWQARQWIKHELVSVNNIKIKNHNQLIHNNEIIYLHPKLFKCIYNNLIYKNNFIKTDFEQNTNLKESLYINYYIYGSVFMQTNFRTLSLKIIYI
uniref:Ribosomal protein S4 n=1 Tax=Cyanidiococcus yangmingshanensis TaxID=2690220 RepID=A0A7H0WBF1_9RHOD|nr:ribosomal protein S4 [Cyanidiococcus yangmingshanensis]UNJ18931.1 ribosomal protein S4 [Cyanidioschyzonaceae sp. 2 FvB-2021]